MDEGKTVIRSLNDDQENDDFSSKFRILSEEELQMIINVDDDKTINHFDDVKIIGKGGNGEVLGVKDRILNREVALKYLLPHRRNCLTYVNKFIREARIMAMVEHPNIVPIHELNILQDKGVYFTMKRLHGETLQVVLNKLFYEDPVYQKEFTMKRLLSIFVSICHAVSFAHSKGVIHRDLKPGNIMIGDYGEVMVMDWGLAKFKHEDNVNPELTAINKNLSAMITQDGFISGTPAYMSPEQACGDFNAIDELSDQYSLGAILYSILTFKPSPYPSRMKMDKILINVRHGKFLPPSQRAPERNIPRELEAICLKAMSLNKRDRYKNIDELIADIHNYSEHYPVIAYQPPPFYKISKTLSRHPFIPYTLIVIMIAAIASYSAVFWFRDFYVQPYLGLIEQNVRFGNLKYDRFKQMTAMHRDELYKKYTSKDYNDTCQETVKYYNNAAIYLNMVINLSPKESGLIDQLLDIYDRELKVLFYNNNYYEAAKLLEQIKFNDNIYEQFISYLPYEKRHQVENIINNVTPLNINLIPQQDQKVILERVSYSPGEPDIPFISVFIDEFNTPYRRLYQNNFFRMKIKSANGREFFVPLNVIGGNDITLNLLVPKNIPDNLVFIQGGEFLSGNSIEKSELVPRSLEGFMIGKYEVTIDEYREFWNQLDNVQKELYMPLIHRKERITKLWNTDGKLLDGFRGDMPIVGITVEAAEAFCRYMSNKHQRIYRLPSVVEWEKAARANDGRRYPTGEFLKDNWALLRKNSDGILNYPNGAPVDAFPKDCSVYGVYNLAGNVREIVRNSQNYVDDKYLLKGGSYRSMQNSAECGRFSYYDGPGADIGFRYVVELDKSDKALLDEFNRKTEQK